jgi:ubiquinone/menaquinone biosynthesis C-methylase UbiE
MALFVKFKKKYNHKSEESFHDEWAKSAELNLVNISAQFNGVTSPEYKKVIEYLGEVANKKILVLGCGLGEEAIYLALKKGKIIAIDISNEMLNFTKKLAKTNKIKNIKFYKMSTENMTFKDNSFDLVLGCNILHHVDIKTTIKEIKRVLKPNGVAAFSEPIKYNPIINIYRVLASHVRTDNEHPLSYEDMHYIKQVFPKFEHIEYHLFTLLIFIWFFIGKRLHPNKVRYWKKIIYEADKYAGIFKLLFNIDKVVLKWFPIFKRYCWVTVIRVVK